MPISRDLTITVDLDDRTLRNLATALGESDKGTLDQVFTRIEGSLTQVANAAFEEYRDHLSGERAPTTVSALREDRLMVLVRHLFGGELPRDTQVEDLFQLTPGEARGLLRRVRARRRFELEAGIRVAARAALKPVKGKKGDRKIRATRTVVEYMNGILERKGTATALIKPDENANGYWIVKETAFKALDGAL